MTKNGKNTLVPIGLPFNIHTSNGFAYKHVRAGPPRGGAGGDNDHGAHGLQGGHQNHTEKLAR